MNKVRLSDRSWSLGQDIGSGGFGRVVEAAAEGMGNAWPNSCQRIPEPDESCSSWS